MVTIIFGVLFVLLAVQVNVSSEFALKWNNGAQKSIRNQGFNQTYNSAENEISNVDIVAWRELLFYMIPFEFLQHIACPSTRPVQEILENVRRSDPVNYRQVDLAIHNPIQYVLIANNRRISVPISKTRTLVNLPDFNRHKKVVILVPGWNIAPKYVSMFSRSFEESFNTRNDTNLILIDFGRSTDIIYLKTAIYSENLGKKIARGLAALSNYVNYSNFQLIGHSLGCHTSGSIGREFRIITGKSIPRITGLDPSKACFENTDFLRSLGRGDGDFVEIIHTNTGVTGLTKAIGDADFYPNGLTALMPGCTTHLCSHARAWQYYVETIERGNEFNFLAQRCDSLDQLSVGSCGAEQTPMGILCPQSARGIYLVNTNSNAPFGRNSLSGNANHKMSAAMHAFGLYY